MRRFFTLYLVMYLVALSAIEVSSLVGKWTATAILTGLLVVGWYRTRKVKAKVRAATATK